MSDPRPPFPHRILLIDDHPAIHDDYRRVFRMAEPKDAALNEAEAAIFGGGEESARGLTFEIDSAFQGEEALVKVQAAVAEGRPYAMAFIDMRMPPGWDGVQTTLRLWEECADLQVVICTAHSDYTWDDMIARFGQTDRLVLLKKPFDPLEVLQLAHALTEKWRLLQQTRAHTAELEERVATRTRELHAANEKLQTEMAERVEVENALRQAQKMEAVGQLAGGIAHDFNNLLSVIRGHTGLLLGVQEIPAAKTQESLREVDDAAERAASLTRQLLTFSRKQVMQPEYLDLNEVIAQVGKLLGRVLGEDIALEIEATANVPHVRADRAMVEQVVMNLAVNARDAMPKGGRLVVRSDTAELDSTALPRHPLARAGRFASFSMTDSGCGIAPEVLPRIFEPFFTTKEVGKGTGLGLATAYGIVKQHGGWIELESTLGRGTTFTIFLPASAKPAAETPRHASGTDLIGGTETILLVEDEAPLLNVTRMVLQHYGYRVLAATSGAEALNMWPEHGAQIDLLLTDVIMPHGVSGPDLAARLTADKPGLKVIMSSGYSRDLLDRKSGIGEEMHFLSKPYTPLKLMTAVRACLDGKDSRSVMAA
jgi:two-component system, NtrC family, sensor kinase